MKLNAIVIVKDDADIIEETLLFAMKFCHRIYLYDNHSTDGTWEIVNSMADRFKQIVVYGQTDQAYKSQFRNRVYNHYRSEYSEQDWWYILGADELLCESPLSLLRRATEQGKTCMSVWLARFYFTDRDNQYFDQEDLSKPVSHRRTYYAINWKDERFFINKPNQHWSEEASGLLPPWANKPFGQSPVCRHYAERTPSQLVARKQQCAVQTNRFFHGEGNRDRVYQSAANLDRYNGDNQFVFRTRHMLRFAVNKVRFWFSWKLKWLNQHRSVLSDLACNGK